LGHKAVQALHNDYYLIGDNKNQKGDHVLCGSGSPVLTATDFVNGKEQF